MNTLAFGYVIPAIRAYSELAPVRQCSCRAYTNKGKQPVFGRSPLFVVFILITSHDCKNGFACKSSRPSLLIKRAALGNLKASFHCTHWHRFFPLKKAFSNPSVSLSKGSSTSNQAFLLRSEGRDRPTVLYMPHLSLPCGRVLTLYPSPKSLP